MKTYSGYTTDTPDELLLDAGAFFVNYEVGTDTYESARTAGKLLGATRGGGEFKAGMSIRNIEVDGVKGRAKGLERNDGWEIYLKATVLSINEDAIKYGLASADIDTASTVSTNHDVITGVNEIELTDYIDNITWIGTLSGSSEPVIIQIFNALNVDGLTLAVSDKNEATMALTFQAHFDGADLETPPFKIWYPKTNG